MYERCEIHAFNLEGDDGLIFVIIMIVVFSLCGIIFAFGKGGFLIAGYNTASKEEKDKYNKKRLTRCMSIFCFSNAIVMAVMGYIDTDKFAISVGLPIILLLIVLLIVCVNKFCKNEESK